MAIYICALLSIITAWAVIKPYFQSIEGTAQFTEKTDLMLLHDQKNRVVHMLRDLELDFSTSKLSKDEYESIKNELSFDLSEILKKIDNSK